MHSDPPETAVTEGPTDVASEGMATDVTHVEAEPPPPPPDPRSVEVRLSKTLAKAWAPIPHALILDLHTFAWREPSGDGGVGKKHSLKPVHFYVLCFLLAMKWDKGDPYPSAKYIADSAGISHTTVLGALADLRKAGLVRTYKRDGSTGLRTRVAYDLGPLIDRLDDRAGRRVAKRTAGKSPTLHPAFEE